MSYMDFSSWPREQEQTFVVYERRANESQKNALMIGIGAAVAVLVFALGIYAGVEPDKKDMTKDMNMSNLTKKAKKSDDAPAPAPKQEAAPAPKQDAPSDKTDKPADPPSDKKPSDKK